MVTTERGNSLQSYFGEVAAAINELEGEDHDSRALLAQNALEEVAGQELAAATNPLTAFTLEKLLAETDLQHALAFLNAILTAEDAFGKVSSDPTGSYIVEQILERIAFEHDSADRGTRTTAEQLLSMCSQVIADNLVACVTDRSSSHVARRLLSTAAGRDVAPAAGIPKQAQSMFHEDDAVDQGIRPSAKDGRKQHGLAERLQQLRRSEVTPPFPQVIYKLTSAVIDHTSTPSMSDLAYHPQAGPFLQALVEANSHLRQPFEQLVVCLVGAGSKHGTAGVSDIITTSAHEMMKDRAGSHMLEAVFMAAPPGTLSKMWARLLCGRLLELSLHPTANFVMQAAFSAARDPQLIKDAVCELQNSFSELLGRNRSGVVAALIAATSRLRTAQSEVCRALSQGLTALAAANTARRGLAVALMTLDGTGQLGQGQQPPPGKPRNKERLSPAGCASLALLLRFPLDACQKFTKAVSSLSAEDAVAVGRDPGGSRVLEAFMMGPASIKQKKALLRQLRGSWATLADLLPGSHLVETCYNHCGAQATREDIAAELAAARKSLYPTRRGPKLIQLTGADIYARSPEEWRHRSQATSAIRADFAELLGNAGSGGGEQGRAAQQGDKESEAVGAVSQPTSATELAAGKKQKRRKGQQQPETTEQPESSRNQDNGQRSQSSGQAGSTDHVTPSAGSAGAAADVAADRVPEETNAQDSKPKKPKRQKALEPSSLVTVKRDIDDAYHLLTDQVGTISRQSKKAKRKKSGVSVLEPDASKHDGAAGNAVEQSNSSADPDSEVANKKSKKLSSKRHRNHAQQTDGQTNYITASRRR